MFTFAFKNLSIALLALPLFVACSTPYQIPETAHKLIQEPYPTSNQLEDAAIKVNKPFAGIESVKFVVVASGDFGLEKQADEYWKRALGELGFAKVINPTEYQQMLIASGVTEKVAIGDAFSLIGLNQASKHLPPFLFIQVATIHLGNAWYRQVMSVTDPSSTATLFGTDRRKLLWSNYDEELTFPLTNAFRSWFIESKIQAKEKLLKSDKDKSKDSV